MKSSVIYGLMAEFEDPTSLVTATERAHREGYRRMDAYSPFPIEELHHALGSKPTRLPLIVLIGGLIGCIGGYTLEYWSSVIAYPVTFECTILAAALSCVLGMLALNGLPMPYHPVFSVPRFALASRNRFFLCIESTDPKFDIDATRHFLDSLNPREVSAVAD